jgi:hypothetical protein
MYYWKPPNRVLAVTKREKPPSIQHSRQRGRTPKSKSHTARRSFVIDAHFFAALERGALARSELRLGATTLLRLGFTAKSATSPQKTNERSETQMRCSGGRS